jgi:hypothetical protein
MTKTKVLFVCMGNIRTPSNHVVQQNFSKISAKRYLIQAGNPASSRNRDSNPSSMALLRMSRCLARVMPT